MTNNKNSAKFAFYYMLSLVALIFTALPSGMIVFQIINKYISDSLDQFSGQFSADSLKFAISALIIAAPIYYLVMRQIQKNLSAGELDKESAVRKWLTYFILFIAACITLGWFIALVNSFLNGELTFKFILKVITVTVITASIFVFYFYDIRREIAAGKKDRLVRIYFYGSLFAILAIFISALTMIDSPARTRDRNLDNLALDKFSRIESAANDYYSRHKKLPAKLADLLVNEGGNVFLTEKDLLNEVSGEKFQYQITGADSYELCATFKTSNKNEDNRLGVYGPQGWPHDAGWQCLKRTVTTTSPVLVK